MGQQLLHLVPISPPTHVSQNELEGACLFHRPKDHLWGAVYLAGKADIQSGVGQHNEAQLSAPVQDAQVAGVVKVHPLVDGVDLNALHTQGGHPSQFLLPAVEVRVHTAEGENAIPLAVQASGGVIDVDHLAGAGGHGEDQGEIYSSGDHGGPQARFCPIGKGAGVGNIL